MADLSVTAASVVAGTAAQTTNGNAGETLTAGQALYKAAATGLWLKADSNSATVEARTPSGIALNGAAINQPVRGLTSGPVPLGATLTAGVAYYLSDTPGGICPVADVGSGEYATLIGIATSTSVLDVDIQASGVAL